jgi:hypothetical protein
MLTLSNDHRVYEAVGERCRGFVAVLTSPLSLSAWARDVCVGDRGRLGI